MELRDDWEKRLALVGAVAALAGLVYALWPKKKKAGLAPAPPHGQDGPAPTCDVGEPCAMNFPESMTEREKYILSKVRSGDFYVRWVPITSEIDGHTARFWVTADALKIDGVRIVAGARAEQQIADLLGASLLTPKLADLIFMQAGLTLKPMPQAITRASRAVVEQSAKIDHAIVAQVGSLDAAADVLVSTVGKHWVIDNELALPNRRDKAENYGWHFYGPSTQGIKGEETASGVLDPTTGQPLRMIQGCGWHHDLNQDDYSQNVVLVLKACEVDGEPTTLAAVLSDPELAPLASHQGVVTVLRQPGVEDLSANA